MGKNNQPTRLSDVDTRTIRATGGTIMVKSDASSEPPKSEKLPLGFFEENGKLMKRIWSSKNEEYYELTICNCFKVLERQKNIATGEISYLIEFEACEEIVREIIPRRNLEAKKLLDNHMALGAPFESIGSNAEIVKYILEEAETLPTTHLSPILGWVRNRSGELAFVCGDYALVKDDGNNSGEDRFIRYCGRLQLSTRGTADKAIAGLNPFLTDSVPLQTAASIGLAASLVYLLEINEVDTIVVHFAQESTSGKSTASSLSVSMFANPEQSTTGLNQRYYQTQNHLTKMLCGNHGFPFGLDESGVAKYTLDDAFGYLLASGNEKGRFNTEPDKSDYGQDRWATAIISTGERSLLNDKLPDGAKIRIIEMCCKWTYSAEQSDKLMRLLTNQHGTIGIRFVKNLLKYDIAKLKLVYAELLKEVRAKAPTDKLTQRFAKTLAIIVTAAALSNKMLGLEIDFAKVTDFLLEVATIDSIQEPLAEQAIDYIKGKILEIHGSAFVWKDDLDGRSGRLETHIWDNRGILGKVVWNKNKHPESVMLTVAFFEGIISRRFGDINAVKRKLIAGGYIIGESNGYEKMLYYKKRRIRGSKLTVIEFDAVKLGVQRGF